MNRTMCEDLSDLPRSAAEIAEVIGRDLALDLIASLPQAGSRTWRRGLYVPKTLPVDHWLVRKLGWKMAQRMSRAFAGMILQPANCRVIERRFHHQAIPDLIRDGLPVDEVAELTRLSAYRVREIASLAAAQQMEGA